MPHSRFMEQRFQDLRFAARQLLRSRGFASAAIGVPALGIAASLALFAFVDAAIIRPLPYAQPSRLVTVFGSRPDLASGQARGSVSYLDFLDCQRLTRTLSEIAAKDVRSRFNQTTAVGPESVPGIRETSRIIQLISRISW